MATVDTAKDKFRAKAGAMPANYNDSVGRFFGVSSSTIAGSGPGRNFANVFSPANIGTVLEKWERNLRAAFGV